MAERNVSRKDFFKLVLDGAKQCAYEVLDGVQTATEILEESSNEEGPTAKLPDFVRPPGALPEKEFLAACTRCDDCVKACPHWVIRKAGPGFGESVADTPIVIPRNNPCLFCDNLPCIAACGPQALIPPAPGKSPKIGLAVVDMKACYLAQGQPCDYCMIHCPEKPNAVTIGERGIPPNIDAEACTGCGICAQICPPNAIRIEGKDG